MADFIEIDSKQHKKEHFVYLGDAKIAVAPLGPDMSEYENVPGITIYALRGWYYISHEDKAMADKRHQIPTRQNTNDSNVSDPHSSAPQTDLKPRNTRLGF